MGIGNTTALGCAASLLLASLVACSGAAGGSGTSDPTPLVTTGADASADPDPPTRSDAGKPTPPPPTSCPSVFPEDAKCQSCFAKSCKTECGTCGQDADCQAALECIGPCTTNSCISACVSGLSTSSRSLLTEVRGETGCVANECAAECGSGDPPPASNKKTGDACSSDAECTSGSCSTWCQDTCSVNTDCGINSSGNLVWCVKTQAATNRCFPGCKSNSDCSIYPGSSCRAITATNGASTSVCTF